VTFQKDLGSYYDKTEKNLHLVANLGAIVRSRVELDVDALHNAAQLAKTDLTTELVKEFTELQGIVGGLYARAQGLSETVAQAIYWQYSPAAIDDPIPPTPEGQLLGIADRFQTIEAMFSLGFAPTGSKDPFGLRRAGNGILKILAESDLPLKLTDLDDEADWLEPQLRESLRMFFRERLEFYLREVRGFAYDVVNAVLAVRFDDILLSDIIARAEALTSVRGSEDFNAISTAFRRIKNILRQASEKGQFNWELRKVSFADENLFREAAERELYKHVRDLALPVELLREQHQYGKALELIATLRPYVDLFFDAVMVIVDDPAIRDNRLRLISEVLSNFSSIADFSEIVTN